MDEALVKNCSANQFPYQCDDNEAEKARLYQEEVQRRRLRHLLWRAATKLRGLEQNENVGAEEHFPPGPLTKESQLRRDYARREEHLWRQLQRLSERRRIIRGLAALQTRARERRRVWECRREGRARREQRRLRAVARRLRLDEESLPDAAFPRLRQHLCRLRAQRQTQLQCRVAVLQQLLSEELYRRRLLRPPPPWTARPKLEQHAAEEPTRTEEKRVLTPPEEIVQDEEKQQAEEQVQEEHDVTDMASEKDKKDKTKGKGKEKKKEPKAKGKKAKAEPPPPPPPPVWRRLVEAEDTWAASLGGPLVWVPPLGADVAAIRAPPPTPLDVDDAVAWRPNVIVFKDFRPGEQLSRCCWLRNSRFLPARVLLLEPELDDDLWLSRLRFQPAPSDISQRLLLPGQAIAITITFTSPDELDKVEVRGWLRALVACHAWSSGSCEGVQRLVTLPLRFKSGVSPPPPTPANPSVWPTVIDFGSIPGWTARGFDDVRADLQLTLDNSGGSPCVASIHPVPEEQQEPTAEKSPLEDAVDTTVEETVVEEVTSKPSSAKSRKRQKKLDKKHTKSTLLEPVIEQKGEAEILREEAVMATSNFLEEAVLEAVQVFQWRGAHRWVTLPPHYHLKLPLSFCPPQSGQYSRRYSVCFYTSEAEPQLLSQVELRAVGESWQLPVHLEPHSGVQLGRAWCSPALCGGPLQQVFRVRAQPAYGPLSLRVSVVPSRLQREGLAELLPRSQTVLRPEKGYAEFLLRLWPRPNIAEASQQEGELRDAQVQVHVDSRLPGLPRVPQLSLGVLPLRLYWPRGLLRLQPPTETLKRPVSTLETLAVELVLLNTTDSIPLRFAILGAPQGVVVYPSRGTVLAGEHLPLQLLLSPRAGLHVPYGRQAIWQLHLRAVSLEQLVDELEHHRPRSGSGKIKLQSNSQGRDGVGTGDVQIPSIKAEPSLHVDLQGEQLIEEQQCRTEGEEQRLTDTKDHPEHPAGGWCQLAVPVLDPRCELSATRLLLPAACMGGCALARVTLRGCNQASVASASVNCRPTTAYTCAWSRAVFSVRCDRRDVTVSPVQGTLVPGQEVKLYFAYRPRLHSRDVRREAELIEERRQEELRAQEELLKAVKGKKKGGSSSGRSRTPTPKSGKRGAAPVLPPGPSPEDLLEAEATLLYAFQPCVQRRVVTFRVTTTDARTGEGRLERLRLELRCPVRRPAFQLLSGRQLDFGPTAAGTCRRLALRMRVVEGPASVFLSPPSPDTPFWLPHCVLPQMVLPSAGEISLPVCYRPLCEGSDDAADEQDCVEVRADDGATAARVQLRGRLVPARLILTPKGVGVWRVQAALGAGVDCAKIDVRNDCEAELHLELVLEAVLSAPETDIESKSPRSSKGGKKSTKGTPKAKGKVKEQKQSPDLLDEERLQLESIYQPVHPLLTGHLFTITPVPAAFDLKPGGKASFKVRFTAPPPPGRAVSEASTKGKKKEKGNGKKGGSPEPAPVSQSTLALTQELLAQQVEQKLKYVARCAMMVGGVVRAHQLWFFGSIKEGATKEKKKKKK